MESLVFEKNLVRVGGVKDGIVFTEEILRKIGKYNSHNCLHYDEETKSLVWRGILWGEPLYSPTQTQHKNDATIDNW